MTGNVEEWCMDRHSPSIYKRFKEGDLRTPVAGPRRVIRGKSWYTTEEGYFRCGYRLRGQETTYRGSETGFRCAKSM